MQQSQDYDGSVFLVIEPSSDVGPPHYISGEAAFEQGHDGPFVPKLIVGIDIGEIEYVDHWYLVTLEKVILQTRLSSLAAAVRAGRENSETWPERIYIHRGEGPIHHDLLDIDPRMFIEVDEFSICARIEERYSRRPSVARDDYRNMIDSIAEKYECHVLDVRYTTADGTLIDDEETLPLGYFLEGEDDGVGRRDFYAEMAHVVDIAIGANDPDSRTGRLVRCGRAISDYLAAIRGGTFDAETIVSLLRAGHLELLIGQREGAHLDVKSALYNIDAPGNVGDRQKIELAQDVVRFANGNTDAVLVLGYAETRYAEYSEVAKLSPVDLSRFSSKQYQAALDARIFPSIIGLQLEAVEIAAGSGIVFIYIPQQPDAMQPYLVHGAIVGEKVEGEFFSIPQRRGEASLNITASQIHGYIVAGKAFLRKEADA